MARKSDLERFLLAGAGGTLSALGQQWADENARADRQRGDNQCPTPEGYHDR